MHLLLAAGSAAFTAMLFYLVSSPDWLFKLSLASGYAALGLLSLSLLMGAWLAWRRGRGPIVHLDARRDVGIWAGLVGLLHVGAGLFVHFRGRPWLYFIYPPDQPQGVPLRYGLFGFANHLGLLATFVLLLLLAISNDYALRRLKRKRWKALQRWNYALFLFVVAHAIGYQIIEERPLPYLVLFAAAVTITVVMQGAGFRTTRQKQNRRR